MERIPVERSGVPETLLGNLGRRAGGVASFAIAAIARLPARLRYAFPVLPVLQVSSARLRTLNET